MRIPWSSTYTFLGKMLRAVAAGFSFICAVLVCALPFGYVLTSLEMNRPIRALRSVRFTL